ncbi:hypothetical protein CLCR_09241 [Cladophialophora carrionii]|uniref:Uncharacterized protein n=1 Tax=Cladophialophora carrionii TaxID=86049 RepID=A0A1C1CQZ4_9EURO|nr:hypothetical protein CLCR_09241 [Cladophialophora carrionii]
MRYLQTFQLSYANTSAYVGRIISRSYAEPLIVGGFNNDDDNNSISFLSTHQSPAGVQQKYIVPHESQAVDFSVPHGSTPEGESTTGILVRPQWRVVAWCINRFYACRNDALAPLNSYQIYWNAAGQPLGWMCQGPVLIQADDV